MPVSIAQNVQRPRRPIAVIAFLPKVRRERAPAPLQAQTARPAQPPAASNHATLENATGDALEPNVRSSRASIGKGAPTALGIVELRSQGMRASPPETIGQG